MMQKCTIDNIVNSVEIQPHLVRKHPHRWRGQHRAKLVPLVVRSFKSTSSAASIGRYLGCRHNTVMDIWRENFTPEEVWERTHRIRSMNRSDCDTYRNHVYGDGWLIDPDGYRIIRCTDGKWRKEHHLALGLMDGVPHGMVVHHHNKNKLDNHPENLQLLTNSQHMKDHQLERLTTIPTGSRGKCPEAR